MTTTPTNHSFGAASLARTTARGVAAAVLLSLLAACATSTTAPGPVVELPFPSPLTGPGGPEVDRKTWKTVHEGWKALETSRPSAASAAAVAAGSTAQGQLLGLQVELLEPGHNPAARISTLTERHPNWAAAWLTLSVAAELEEAESTAYAAAERGAQLWDRQRWQARVAALYDRWVVDRAEEASNLFDQEDLEGTLAVLAEALALDHDYRPARLLQIQTLAELNRFDEAEQALADFGDEPEAVVLTAEIAERQQDWPRAMALYSSLPDDYPDRAAALRRAQIRWRLSVLPGYVRDALDSEALTRAELAVILVALAPEVEAMEGGTVPVLSDIVDLPSQREVLAVVRAELLTVDPLEHRFHPHREARVDEITDALEALCHLLGYQAPYWCIDEPELIPSPCMPITPPVGGEFLAELVLGLAKGVEP